MDNKSNKFYKLTPEQIETINAILSAGDRIELIPAKDNQVKVIQEVRKEVK